MNWKGEANGYNGGDAIGVWARSFRTCILLLSGNVTCSGEKYDNEQDEYLGGDAVSIGFGTWHTCFLLNTGGVSCQGSNYSGEANPYDPKPKEKQHWPIFARAFADESGCGFNVDTGVSPSPPWAVGVKSECAAYGIPDKDSDGLPDGLEPQACGSAAKREVVKATEAAVNHACKSPSDYTPPYWQATVVGTNVQQGPDNDGDGLPTHALVEMRTLVVRPFNGELVSSQQTTPLHINLDSNDQNPEAPLKSTFTSPKFVTKLTPGPDADNDGIPSHFDVEWAYLVLDRRDLANPTLKKDPAQTIKADPDDTNPDDPAPSRFGPLLIPTGANPGPDADGDGIPLNVVVSSLSIVIDRSKADPVSITSGSITISLDPDDADPSNPAPSRFGPVSVPYGVDFGPDNDKDRVPAFVRVVYLEVEVDRTAQNPIIIGTSKGDAIAADPDDGAYDDPLPRSFIDADGDFVIDAAERWICFVEDETTTIDGSCDASRSDYHPPII